MHGTAEHMPKLVPLLCIASSCLCVPACYPDCPCIAKCSIYRCMYVPLTTIVYVDYRRNRVFYICPHSHQPDPQQGSNPNRVVPAPAPTSARHTFPSNSVPPALITTTLAVWSMALARFLSNHDYSRG